MEPPAGQHRPHAPPPSLWPVGFAVGIAVLLTGVILGWVVVAIGALLTAIFGFLWVRDVTGGLRTVPDVEPERREVAPPAAPIRADEGGAGMVASSESEIERFPRSKFLEGATLGLGAAIGGVVTAPVLGFAVLPAFRGGEHEEVDVGAVDDFPEKEWMITTFRLDPDLGDVTARTAYVRNNGMLDGRPSFTIVSNRCVHLGCPVQPNGPAEDKGTQFDNKGRPNQVIRVPTKPAGFGCPCHGGQYDTEGNPTAGPPVRALDRFEFSIRGGRLFIGKPYSVGGVRGEAADAVIRRYDHVLPGVHVEGPSALMYPLEPPR